ncbi:HsdM family class I SAM-dependent methyltransferase [Pedobacter kyonggii]|uniref:SAM-dependent DNA methyltransferase n=1 Tax=Pedobacter kyonggii TaxID=1926871 RepID=A0A4Q9HD34_9SPHI|nr:N-6 DNA methylase [Pedobacter kyonggii]TBO42251.1 SAM-dependent DNA methyltransferase [Pedobacter kyonggii]
MAKANLNERSWAIDVISEINLIVRKRNRNIRHAGGERTIKASKQSASLFPDVLLFQDDQNLRVLQGWELKMPDTNIGDEDLLENAEKKARLLGLNSFLVWNFSKAALYVLEENSFVLKKEWDELSDIKTRKEVDDNKSRWKAQLKTIIDDLEDFFHDGVIKSQEILHSLTENNIVDIITGNIALVKENIDRERRSNSILDAEISEWWDSIKLEYSSEPDASSAVAKIVLITWVNRVLFTHYLKKFTNKAKEIDLFNESTSVSDAKLFFNELTSENDFLNVYAPVIGEDQIDDAAWQHIIQLSAFLSDLKLENIDQGVLQQFFETLLLDSKRKTAGQYATPYPIASLMAKLVIHDKNKTVFDPFCGTGTILRAVYDLKDKAGINAKNNLDGIWGSDKFSFPLHMTTLSLAKPSSVGEVLNIFKSDVKDLKTGKAYNFIDPNTGTDVSKPLPTFDYIISNLPFIGSANISKSNPQIGEIIGKIRIWLADKKITINKKSDIIAYLPYYLWDLLGTNGRIGLVVSNSWLGTGWGNDFRDMLFRFFKISSVISSGKGKWFKNAEVITNIMVLEKRPVPVDAPLDNEETSFVLINSSIDEISDPSLLDKTANQIILKKNGLVSTNTLEYGKITKLESFGLGWPALFIDLSWFDKISSKLTPAKTFFDINRGERRGWDPMFMPTGSHGIEAKYLQPVLKNLKSTTGLIANPTDEAFCCSETIANLTAEGSAGTLKWISKFEHALNGTKVPLKVSLARANHHWYEMKSDSVADLVANINYGSSLKIVKMRKRGFVNQRLIRLTAKNSHVEVDILHALMNSYLGLFYIEALGFGRGMGALDLNSTKFKDSYQVLNPALLATKQKQDIKGAFIPLMKRPIQHLDAEMQLADRIHFEKTVADAFGFGAQSAQIQSALLSLYSTRTEVN